MQRIAVAFLCIGALLFGTVQVNKNESRQVQVATLDKELRDFARDIIFRQLRILIPPYLLPFPALPRLGGFQHAIGNCDNPCVIKSNGGGYVQEFQTAALEVLSGKKDLVVIDGDCVSACTIFADMARSKVCITDRARFGFHKVRLGKTRSNPPMSEDIDEWVYKNFGTYPPDDLKYMSAKEALQFWPLCQLQVPLPRSDPRKVRTRAAG